MTSAEARPYALLARNNAWANRVLLDACVRLSPEDWAAERTGFFPSLRETLHHVHAVDLYYLDALSEGGLGPAVFHGAPRDLAAEALAREQAALDERFQAFCEALDASALAREVVTDRGPVGRVRERVDHLLLHLFQHQIHHRGQAHAMLAGTPVKPPQLDEFFLDYDRHPLAAAMMGEAS